jgi:pyruvate/2-oxoglutarate dehydrogenase complex dihydrolipoamide acyltransferase (E2) component
VSENRAPQNSDAEEAPVKQRRDGVGITDATGRSAGEQPDVLLDVPNLEVDRITLEVESLRAHVSVLAELANLVNLSVGADVRLDQVKLEIEGVKAQALLKVRLEHVRAILEKALDTVGEHPEILEILAQTLSEVLREALGTARAALDDVLEGLEVGDTVDELLNGRLEDIRADLDEALEGQGGEAQEALDEGSRTVRRVVDESGTVVEQTLNQSDEVTQEAVIGDASTTAGAAREEEGEARATPAAERRARELGVDLSSVAGTGVGGRITFRDVQNAAQA